jgi:hypothetical protein
MYVEVELAVTWTFETPFTNKCTVDPGNGPSTRTVVLLTDTGPIKMGGSNMSPPAT